MAAQPAGLEGTVGNGIGGTAIVDPGPPLDSDDDDVDALLASAFARSAIDDEEFGDDDDGVDSDLPSGTGILGGIVAAGGAGGPGTDKPGQPSGSAVLPSQSSYPAPMPPSESVGGKGPPTPRDKDAGRAKGPAALPPVAPPTPSRLRRLPFRVNIADMKRLTVDMADRRAGSLDEALPLLREVLDVLLWAHAAVAAPRSSSSLPLACIAVGKSAISVRAWTAQDSEEHAGVAPLDRLRAALGGLSTDGGSSVLKFVRRAAGAADDLPTVNIEATYAAERAVLTALELRDVFSRRPWRDAMAEMRKFVGPIKARARCLRAAQAAAREAGQSDEEMLEQALSVVETAATFKTDVKSRIDAYEPCEDILDELVERVVAGATQALNGVQTIKVRSCVAKVVGIAVVEDTRPEVLERALALMFVMGAEEPQPETADDLIAGLLDTWKSVLAGARLREEEMVETGVVTRESAAHIFEAESRGHSKEGGVKERNNIALAVLSALRAHCKGAIAGQLAAPGDIRAACDAGMTPLMSVDDTTEEVEDMVESQLPSKEEVAQKRALQRTLSGMVRRMFVQNRRFKDIHKADIEVYGSSASGFGLASADMDTCLVIERCDNEKDVRNIILRLKDALERDGFEDINAIIRARVPVCKFTAPQYGGIECDICINNTLAVHNTALLRAYADLDERVAKLAFAVKFWTKRRGINDPPMGTFSSYAYVLMVICYLQQCSPPVLPSLQSDELVSMYRESGGRRLRDLKVDAHKVLFVDDVPWVQRFVMNAPGSVYTNGQSIGELLVGFFTFMCAQFNPARDALCIKPGGRGGSVVREKESIWRRVKRWRIAVEDPFEADRDLGSVVQERGQEVINQEFRRAFGLIYFGQAALPSVMAAAAARVGATAAADRGLTFTKEELVAAELLVSEVDLVLAIAYDELSREHATLAEGKWLGVQLLRERVAKRAGRAMWPGDVAAFQRFLSEFGVGLLTVRRSGVQLGVDDEDADDITTFEELCDIPAPDIAEARGLTPFYARGGRGGGGAAAATPGKGKKKKKKGKRRQEPKKEAAGGGGPATPARQTQGGGASARKGGRSGRKRVAASSATRGAGDSGGGGGAPAQAARKAGGGGAPAPSSARRKRGDKGGRGGGGGGGAAGAAAAGGGGRRDGDGQSGGGGKGGDRRDRGGGRGRGDRGRGRGRSRGGGRSRNRGRGGGGGGAQAGGAGAAQ